VDRGNDNEKEKKKQECEFGKMRVMLRIGYKVNLFILLI
jgi:hypothetical protein